VLPLVPVSEQLGLHNIVQYATRLLGHARLPQLLEQQAIPAGLAQQFHRVEPLLSQRAIVSSHLKAGQDPNLLRDTHM
jgi:hypothetical protein